MSLCRTIAISIVLLIDSPAFAVEMLEDAKEDGRESEPIQTPEPKRKNIAPEPPMFLRYTYSLPSSLKDNSEGKSVKSHQLELGAATPLYVGKKLIIAAPIKYQAAQVLLEGIPDYVGSQIRLHRIEGLLLGVWKPNPKWSLSLRAGAVMAGDFLDIDEETFQPSVTAVATTRLTKSDTLFFGLSLARAFFVFFPIPVLGIVHRPPDSAVWFDAILPGFVRLRLRRADYLELVPFVDVKGGSWSVEGREKLVDHHLEKLEIRGGLAVRLKLFGPFWFEAEVGGTFYGRYEAVDRDGDSMMVLHRVPHLFITSGVILVP